MTATRRVLLAGIPAEVGRWLESRLPGLTSVVCPDSEALGRELPGADLVLIDHALVGGPEVLRASCRAIPIFFSLDNLFQADVTRDLEVTRLLVHPLDPEELLHHLRQALPTHNPTPDQEASAALSRLWTRHRPATLERARLLTNFGENDEQRRAAERAAHQLAGSAGSFGYTRVSELAREAEGLLSGSGPLERARIERLGGEILSLLEQAPPVATVSESAPVVDAEPCVEVWKERLNALEAAARELAQGRLDGAARVRAAQDARRLRLAAGLMGVLRAADLAGELEELLSRADLPRAAAGKFAERVLQIRQELNRKRPVVAAGELHGRSVLLSGADPERLEDLRQSLRLSGLRVYLLPLERAADELPAIDGAFLEYSPDQRTGFFRLVSRLTALHVPTLVAADQAGLSERVRASRLGTAAFVEPGTSLDEISSSLLGLVRAGQEGGQGRTVLAVDDDPTLLDTVQTLLGGAGFAIHTESDPLAAWGRLGDLEPELIILDVDMPQLTGIELCRVIRQDPRWANLPILFLSANRDSETIARMFAAGGDDYVMKPVVGPELVSRVKSRLDRFRRNWAAVQSGQTGGRRLARERLEWLLQLGYRLQQPVCLGIVGVDAPRDLRPVARALKPVVEIGDVVARWSQQSLVVAMMATTRQSGRERLQRALKGRPVRSALACFPADGSDLETLVGQLEAALSRAAPGVVATPAAETGRTHDVLVVDDDEALSELVSATLSEAGLTTLAEGSPQAALASLEARRVFPRVLLLDVDMPELDGFAVLDQLNRSGLSKQIRVIMLTGTSDAQRRVFQAIQAGAFDYVAKPFQPELLIARVWRARESLS